MEGKRNLPQSPQQRSDDESFGLQTKAGKRHVGGSTWNPVFWEHLLWKEPGRKLAKLGTSLMLGGAVGNTYDRFKRGYVVDYLSLKTKNRKLSDITFNLSDLALFAGAILTVWSSLFGKKR